MDEREILAKQASLCDLVGQIEELVAARDATPPLDGRIAEITKRNDEYKLYVLREGAMLPNDLQRPRPSIDDAKHAIADRDALLSIIAKGKRT